ncbi:MAG: MoaD/ThiS family protein [Gemmatimonadales bacterium]
MATGTVRLKFFARYAELVGCDHAELAVPLPATVGDVVRAARAALPGADALPERPLAAVNLRHARLDAPVRDGDEVAFLPPVAGG